MTSSLTNAAYAPIADAIFSATEKKAPVDSSTRFRASRILTANAGGSSYGTFAAPLNSGQQTNFILSNGGDVKFRFDSMALRIQMCFTQGNNTALTAPIGKSSPPWNLVPFLVDSLQFTVNGQSVQMVNFASGQFGPAFTAQMLQNYSFQALNEMSGSLFTPVYTGGAEGYTIANVVDASYVAGVDDGCIARANRWFQPNSAQRIVTKVIPFSQLLPDMPHAVWKNLTDIRLNIRWVNNIDLCESANVVSAFGAPDATRAAVYVLGCDVVEDSYAMSSSTSVGIVKEKIGQATDIIPCRVPKVHNPASYVPGGVLQIPNTINADCVMVIQPCRGADNGQVGANQRFFTSLGQFMLFNTNGGPAGAMLTRANMPITAGYTVPISNARIELGSDVSYPIVPCATSQTVNATVALEPCELWSHYAKATTRYTRWDTTPAVPFEAFTTTMPFVCFRPWSDAAPHANMQSVPLRVYMQGGGNPNTSIAGQNNIFVIVFEYKAFTIRSDGVVVDTTA